MEDRLEPWLRVDYSAERSQVSRSYPKETVAHKGKGFELYMLLNKEPMKGVLHKARSMVKFWNAAYETGSSIDNRLKPKNTGGSEANVKALPLFCCHISINTYLK